MSTPCLFPLHVSLVQLDGTHCTLKNHAFKVHKELGTTTGTGQVACMCRIGGTCAGLLLLFVVKIYKWVWVELCHAFQAWILSE